MKSGGYIVIDQTEAMTVIDVNTGKFVGKEELEDTILKTNLEAVKELAYQIRLRNLGGIIIVDFMDMQKYENREALHLTIPPHLLPIITGGRRASKTHIETTFPQAQSLREGLGSA